jgi:hypothetical protein
MQPSFETASESSQAELQSDPESDKTSNSELSIKYYAYVETDYEDSLANESIQELDQ